MPKRKTKPAKIRSVKVELTGRIYPPETLFLRNSMADGSLPDGRTYEVCSNVNGDSIIVRRCGPRPGPWLVLSAEQFLLAYARQIDNNSSPVPELET